MLFKQFILDKLATGQVTLAFRRWNRPTVKAGGCLKTSVGVLHIRSLETIDEERITLQAARRAGFDSIEELLDSLGEREGELYRIEFERAGDDPRIALREDADLSEGDIKDLRSRLSRLDDRNKSGPWTTMVLRLIASHPERRAADLANQSGFEKEWLKTNIRKLKNLGLTESLEVGYRLSPRGEAFLAAIQADPSS